VYSVVHDKKNYDRIVSGLLSHCVGKFSYHSSRSISRGDRKYDMVDHTLYGWHAVFRCSGTSNNITILLGNTSFLLNV
jgi:hypothetical protein